MNIILVFQFRIMVLQINVKSSLRHTSKPNWFFPPLSPQTAQTQPSTNNTCSHNVFGIQT